MREIQRYQINETTIIYYENPNGGCEWIIVPSEKVAEVVLPIRQKVDSLIQVKVTGDDYPKGFVTGTSMRNSGTVQQLVYESQSAKENEETWQIITNLRDQKNNYYQHYALVDKQTGVIETFTKFGNQSGQVQQLEMLSSFSLSCLSPFYEENQVGNLFLTRYRSKWSFEGRKEKRAIEEFQLEPSWKPSGAGVEKFGQVGSMPVRGWFPTVALSDEQAGVSWAARLAHPGSWQMEAYCLDEDLCLSGGIADRDFGSWTKKIAPGESFETPHAYLVVCLGNEVTCGNQLNHFFTNELNKISHEDEQLPILFNEFCTTWGKPSEESVLAALPILQEHDIDYYVIDAGWYADAKKGWEQNMGDWLVNAEQFPRGIKPVIQAIQAAGMVPGIWFEFETVGRDAQVFSETEHLLKKDGYPITTGGRRFWQMNDPWVRHYLEEKVIQFLEDNQIGYIKIDYNDNFGAGFDAEESLGEANRQQLAGSQAFFDRIRNKLPRLIMENCSSGGHRLEPSFLIRTDLSSFSDAHEAWCIPIIGGNLHELIPPVQSLMWAVIRQADSLQRIQYILSANFLGRLCLSGDIQELSCEQWQVIDDGIAFYRRVATIIKDGSSERYGNPVLSYRKPAGSQAVLRYGRTNKEVLLVVHSFQAAKPLLIPFSQEYRLEQQYGAGVTLQRKGALLQVDFTEDFQGAAFLFVKEEEDD
ncbi:glycoside hydrolase family 36 protein [Enterococcus sp. OL5]|uniref:glycoside hydrolase family 36 protein n=1 Tax=Enterococcus sp. OL5 TaxID=2590214 RepID=UPI001128645B|nr:glycoside hydrolase family 36 protein [Enterococcus sp. OL5]TPR56900.1 alpha-galactosidase [Enterococcus sp. OL5]